MNENKIYVAMYGDIATRDVQVCKKDPYGDDIMLDDSAWEDILNASVFIGIYYGTPDVILSRITASEHCHEDAIRLLPVPTDFTGPQPIM